MSTRLTWILLVTMVFGSAPADAQSPASDPSRPIALAVVTSQGAVANQDSAADRDDDFGVDMAIVKVDSANMRGIPSTNGELVRKLPRRSMLVLITRDATEGWYNVVDARSGLDGWVHGELVDLRLTSRAAATPFKATQVDTTSPPRIEANNESDYMLSLKVGTQTYTIPPGTTLNLTLPAGSHRYIATAPNVIPAAGVKTWETGHLYTWRFYVQ
jgi:hypothetical protein